MEKEQSYNSEYLKSIDVIVNEKINEKLNEEINFNRKQDLQLFDKLQKAEDDLKLKEDEIKELKEIIVNSEAKYNKNIDFYRKTIEEFEEDSISKKIESEIAIIKNRHNVILKIKIKFTLLVLKI